MICPFNKELPPKYICYLGKNKECPYWVEDRKSKYCIWKWIDDHPGPNTYEVIGKALGKTGARIHQEIMYNIIPKLQELLKGKCDEENL